MSMFEVWRGNQRLAETDSPVCIPDKETRASMRGAGCSFKSNGKTITEKEIQRLEGKKEA